jgi:hypothetical protein
VAKAKKYEGKVKAYLETNLTPFGFSLSVTFKYEWTEECAYTHVYNSRDKNWDKINTKETHERVIIKELHSFPIKLETIWGFGDQDAPLESTKESDDVDTSDFLVIVVNKNGGHDDGRDDDYGYGPHGGDGHGYGSPRGGGHGYGSPRGGGHGYGGQMSSTAS